mgnify:CR=1 FL=1
MSGKRLAIRPSGQKSKLEHQKQQEILIVRGTQKPYRILSAAYLFIESLANQLIIRQLLR